MQVALLCSIDIIQSPKLCSARDFRGIAHNFDVPCPTTYAITRCRAFTCHSAGWEVRRLFYYILLHYSDLAQSPKPHSAHDFSPHMPSMILPACNRGDRLFHFIRHPGKSVFLIKVINMINIDRHNGSQVCPRSISSYKCNSLPIPSLSNPSRALCIFITFGCFVVVCQYTYPYEIMCHRSPNHLCL